MAESSASCDADEEALTWVREEIGINQILGLFDTPAFARRGQDTEYALELLHKRCREERTIRLQPARKRFGDWASTASGPKDWRGSGLNALQAELEAETLAPADWRWGTKSRGLANWRERASARALLEAVAEFNRLWPIFLENLDLDRINELIDGYNRFYLLEKECVIGSRRAAARLFVPKTPVTVADLLALYPLLPELD